MLSLNLKTPLRWSSVITGYSFDVAEWQMTVDVEFSADPYDLFYGYFHAKLGTFLPIGS